MKLLKFSLALIGALFFCFLAFGIYAWATNESHSRRKHAQEIESAYNDKLLPAAAFIRGFAEREHRLPTNEEFEATGWHMGSSAFYRSEGTTLFCGGFTIYRSRADCPFREEWGTPGRDFVLETSVPDWNLYYRSWDNKRIEANWE